MKSLHLTLIFLLFVTLVTSVINYVQQAHLKNIDGRIRCLETDTLYIGNGICEIDDVGRKTVTIPAADYFGVE